MSNAVTQRSVIAEIGRAMIESDARTTDMREFTDHFFAEGIYLRTLFVPAGHLVVGANHKHDVLNIVLKGRAVMVNDMGESFVCEAPYVFVAKPGHKAGYAETDVWYANVFPNEDNMSNVTALEQKHTEVFE